MLLSKTTALAVLNEGLATGADYAEIYVEETKGNNLTLENGKVESLSASSSIVRSAGRYFVQVSTSSALSICSSRRLP